MSAPTVSLVIATFNRGPRIAATLDGVLAQTRRPDEIIVVDDASPDRTGDWVERNYPTVRVVRAERNGGTSVARNLGAEAATGSVLVFLDHDDELLPHAVEALVELLASFPEARAAFADHSYTDAANGVRYPDHHAAQPAFARLGRVPVVRGGALGRLYGRPLYRALLWGNLLQQPWAVYRDTFRSLGGFDPDVRYCEDWDLYLRLTRSVPVSLTDRVISNHVIDGENLHLRPGQAAMHERVIRGRLRAERFRDPRAAFVLSRRLGSCLKAAGDRCWAEDRGAAWRLYLRSFARWPFDRVVAARALVLWPLRLLAGHSTAPVARAEP